MINSVIEKLKKNMDLQEEDLKVLVNSFREKNVAEEEIKNLIIYWKKKGEKAEELVLLANILFELQPQIEIKNIYPIVDVCGTGGDKLNTFNISTLSAIVASACGAKIIKHSGKSTTSVSGSLDILEIFGININETNEIKEDIFKKTGLMFVASPILRELFSEVKILSKKINSTCFVNLLGPITNPYKTNVQFLGVSSMEWGEVISKCLKLQNKTGSIVATSNINTCSFLDELSFCGKNIIWEVRDEVSKKNLLLNLPNKKIELSNLSVMDKNQSKIIFEEILKGNNSKEYISKIEVVALNAGTSLYVGKITKSIEEGYKIALNNILNGNVWEHFNAFLNFYRQAKK